MYVYLYDESVRQRKHEPTVKAMETRLTDFGIAGKILRLQPFTNAQAVIEEEIMRGATTIVIVGNDATFARILSRGASCDTVFGFLPVGSTENTIADVLGIPVGVDACDVLAKRRKVNLDIGWVNNRYFISQLHIEPQNIQVQYDEQFTVSSTMGKMELVVCNLQPFFFKDKGKEVMVHPQDGKLEAFLRPLMKKSMLKEVYEEPSIFPFEEMTVTSDKPFVMKTDGKESKEKKVTIRLARKRIEMIVGRGRQF